MNDGKGHLWIRLSLGKVCYGRFWSGIVDDWSARLSRLENEELFSFGRLR